MKHFITFVFLKKTRNLFFFRLSRIEREIYFYPEDNSWVLCKDMKELYSLIQLYRKKENDSEFVLCFKDQLLYLSYFSLKEIVLRDYFKSLFINKEKLQTQCGFCYYLNCNREVPFSSLEFSKEERMKLLPKDSSKYHELVRSDGFNLFLLDLIGSSQSKAFKEKKLKNLYWFKEGSILPRLIMILRTLMYLKREIKW